jgi:hypothetical protein
MMYHHQLRIDALLVRRVDDMRDLPWIEEVIGIKSSRLAATPALNPDTWSLKTGVIQSLLAENDLARIVGRPSSTTKTSFLG